MHLLGPYHFCPLLCPSLHECSFGISDFLEEISSFSHSIVFLYFFALISKEGFLSLLAILWNSAFKWVYLSFSPLPFSSLFSSPIYKASSDNHFAFLHRFFGRVITQSAKTRSGADCGSDHEFLITKFRLKSKKVGKTTRPFRYDLNQIPYDYTVEVRNRFKGLDLIDRVPDEL